MTKKRKHYSVETKLFAIKMYTQDGYSQKEIAKKFGLRDASQLRKWLTKYRKEGVEGFRKTKRGRPQKDPKDKDEIIRRLKVENTLLKALALELGEELPERLDIEPYSDIEEKSE
jgi:transposase